DELKEKLQGFLDGKRDSRVHYYRVDASACGSDESIFSGPEGQEFIRLALEGGKHNKLARLWAQGTFIDWLQLHCGFKPRRVSLPTYPFAKERYWVGANAARASGAAGMLSRLHPLLHENTSDLSQQSYRTRLSGQEFYLADHQVVLGGGDKAKVLPAVAYLEM